MASNKKVASTYFAINNSIIDYGSSIRRVNRLPIDESSVFNTYSALIEEMKSPNSSIYKGQILSVKSDTSTDVVAYIIKNLDNGSNTSYYAERIIDFTYLDEALRGKFVRPQDLGTTYTGVGQWYDASHNKTAEGEPVATITYNEIFNDYVENIAGSNDLIDNTIKYAHAEGQKTNAQGTASHAEGYSTSTVGMAAHAEGKNTQAQGEASHTQNGATIAKNTYESASGVFNMSYTGEEISAIYNTFDSSREESHKANYDISYSTLFTIGDGTSESTRHNIMDIRKNGQMYYAGSAIIGGEVAAPVSFSYVASLGPTAYLTTILSALLTQPQYYRPELKYQFFYDSYGETNNSTAIKHNYYGPSTAGTTLTVEVGAEFKVGTRVCASRVAADTDDKDPNYGTYIGNRLGYSTGITEYNIKQGLPLKNYYTEELITKTLSKSDIDTLSGNYKGSNCNNIYSSKVVYADTDVSIPEEKEYIVFENVSYKFNGSTQMYFQQLTEKSTYVGANGLAPYDKFNETTFTSSNPQIKIRGRYKIYYNTSTTLVASDNIKKWELANLCNGNKFVWADPTKNSNTTVNNITFGNTIKSFWIAVPEDLYEITRYNDSNIPEGKYIYYKNELNAVSSLDTGLSTDSQSSARMLYTYITEKNINWCGKPYKIYIVYAPGGITKGTIQFSVKRIK